MFESTKLISKVNSLTNELKQDHIFFNNCLLGEKKEEFIIQEMNLLIREHGLDNKTRKQHLVHKRFYISFFLYRKLGLTLTDIGLLFKQNHSTIIHGIKKHDIYMETKDFKYLTDTMDIKKAFEDKSFEKFISDKMDNALFNDTEKFKESQLSTIAELQDIIIDLKILYK